MRSSVTKQGANERLVEVAVTEEELLPHFDLLYKKYQKNLRLEGFRKGKVPLQLVKKMYGDSIRSEAIEEVVQSVFQEITKKEELRPVAPAKLRDIDYQPGSGLEFKAVVEVFPEIELKHYRKLSVERDLYQLSNEDINAALADVQEQMAVMNPVEGAAEHDHYVLADFQQVDAGGIPIIGKKFEDRFFQLNGDDAHADLTEQLIGVKAGETRRVELPVVNQSNPNDQQKELYDITIKEVKEKELPELDDELARDVGDFESLDKLREDIEKKLQDQTESNSRRQLRQRLIDEILKKNSFDLPESMLEHYLEAFVEGAKKQSNGEVDEEVIKSEYRASAIWNLKWELVKERIAELEHVTVSDEDDEIFIARFATERGIDEKQLRKSLKTKQAKKRFREEILETKVLDLIEESAKIKVRKINRKDVEKAKSLLNK
ncbi:trigger factor [bacterium]|nr:trigger factor [bacterium]